MKIGNYQEGNRINFESSSHLDQKKNSRISAYSTFTCVSSSKLTRKVQKVKENLQTFPGAALMLQWQEDQTSM